MIVMIGLSLLCLTATGSLLLFETSDWLQPGNKLG